MPIDQRGLIGVFNRWYGNALVEGDFTRTPEDYFCEYADREPFIWDGLMKDLGFMKGKF